MVIQSIASQGTMLPQRRASANSAQFRQDSAAQGEVRVRTLPVERVIEGELLERRGRTAGAEQSDFLARFLMSRYSGGHGGDTGFQTGEAIDAYVSNRRLEDTLERHSSQYVDFYV